MHSLLTKPPPKPEEKIWEIRDLNGKVWETRPTYWEGLLRGYTLLKCGQFTVEERK